MTNLTDRIERYRFSDSRGKIVDIPHQNLRGRRTYTLVNPLGGKKTKFTGEICYIEGYYRDTEPGSPSPNGRFEAFYIEEYELKPHLIAERQLGVRINLVSAGKEKMTLNGIVQKEKGHQYKGHLIVDLLDVVKIE